MNINERGYGDGNQTFWKVGHPTVSNEIVPMSSFGAQPRFFLGGSQVPFYLGIKGNSSGSGSMTETQKHKHKKHKHIKNIKL